MKIRSHTQFQAAIVLTLLMSCGLSYATHPLITEDTSVQTNGKQQIELNSDHNSEQGKQSQTSSLLYSYGASDQLDLFITTPMRWSAPAAMGDLSLGGKYLVSDADGKSWALKTEVFLPTGSLQKQFSKDSRDLALTLVHSIAQSKSLSHFNLSVTQRQFRQEQARQEQRETIWRASAASLLLLTQELQILADIGAYQADIKNEKYLPRHLVAGLIYSPASYLDLDMGIKYLRQKTHIERQVGMGITWRF
jgi:hypothetical protein